MLHRHKGISIGNDIDEAGTGFHREKSINYACGQLREPFQRDFVTMSRLLPYLNLLFPWFIARPLKGRGKPCKLSMTKIGREEDVQQYEFGWSVRHRGMSQAAARESGRPMIPLFCTKKMGMRT